jgi:hypothetical protein
MKKISSRSLLVDRRLHITHSTMNRASESIDLQFYPAPSHAPFDPQFLTERRRTDVMCRLVDEGSSPCQCQRPSSSPFGSTPINLKEGITNADIKSCDRFLGTNPLSLRHFGSWKLKRRFETSDLKNVTSVGRSHCIINCSPVTYNNWTPWSAQFVPPIVFLCPLCSEIPVDSSSLKRFPPPSCFPTMIGWSTGAVTAS